MYHLPACNRGLFKSHDCFIFPMVSLENVLVEKWVTLEVQGWYNCQKLSKLGC